MSTDDGEYKGLEDSGKLHLTVQDRDKELQLEIEQLDYATKQSGLIRTIFEQDSEATEIPINTEVNSLDALRLAVQYINLRGTDVSNIIKKPLPFDTKTMDKVTNEKDANFIDNIYNKGGITALYELVTTASYFDMQPLVSRVCAKIILVVMLEKSEEDMRIALTPNRKGYKPGPFAKIAMALGEE